MLTKNTSVILFTLCSAALPLQAAVILDNDFSDVDAGSYRSGGGTPNPVFDAENPLLGRVYGGGVGGQDYTTNVVATGGVGDSARAGTNAASQNAVIRSTDVASTTVTTSFSMYFQFGSVNGNTTNNHMIVGSGWTNSNLNYFNGTGMEHDTFLVGLRQHDAGASVKFAVGGKFNQPLNIDETAMAMTVGNWYQLSYDLTFDGTDTWTIGNLDLSNRGVDGLAVGVSLGSIASHEVNPTGNFAVNLDSTTTAWAAFFGNADRNAGVIDNLSAVAVPEPSTYALMLGFLALGGVAARRRLRK